MDEREKTYLMSIIALDSKLKVNDKSVAAEIAFIKEYDSEKQINKAQLYDIVMKHIDANNENNKDLLRYAITELELPDKDYLLMLTNMPPATDKEAMKKFLSDVLTSSSLVISDPEVHFNFYNRIVFMAIQSEDSDLTEKAINKIQSL